MALPQVFFIGNNRLGQCILPNTGAITVPAAAPRDWLSDGTLVLKTVAGYELTLLLANDNQLFAVGSNVNGQLGRGHSNAGHPDNRVPRPVTGFGLERITHIAAGGYHCAAVTEGGKVLLWGLNTFKQCGTRGRRGCRAAVF